MLLRPALLYVSLLAGLTIVSLASSAQTEACKFTILPIFVDTGGTSGINSSDTVVGSYFVMEGGQAYLRGFVRKPDGIVSTFKVPSSQSTYMAGINDEGVIIGGFNYQAASRAYGFKLMGSKLTRLISPGAATTNPSGINNHGEIVGTEQSTITSPSKGFLFHNGQFTNVTFPDALATAANAINDQQVIVGSYSDKNGVTHGFVLVKGHYLTLDFPGSVFSTLTGINNAGEIVGQYTLMNGPLQSFVYENGHFETVNIPDAYRSSVNAVNARGDLTGTTFTRPNQAQPSFIATNCM